MSELEIASHNKMAKNLLDIMRKITRKQKIRNILK